MTYPHRFVIEAIDTMTDCVAKDVIFDVGDLSELPQQLSMDEQDFDPYAEYELDPPVFDRLRKFFNLTFDAAGCAVRLRPWRPLDSLPYKVHTNRELALMLEGKKPLAAFVSDCPEDPERPHTPERVFDAYVKSGRFVRRQ